MATGWVFDPAYLNHDPGLGHPESPRRLQAVVERVERSGLLARLVRLAVRPATKDEILMNHSAAHYDRVWEMCRRGGGHLDGDTSVSEGSWDAALRAAGGAIAAVDATMNGQVNNAFCCLRPPGHHAEEKIAMGFCLFNNTAIAARHLINKRGLSRVLIVDWDAHHGNGTQHSFYDDPRAFYFSTHLYPFYPGTGAAWETGEGPGEGYTLNVPLSAGSGDNDFVAAFTDHLIPAMERLRPEFVLLSAGFDPHVSDPLTWLGVTDEGFVRAGLIIRELADRYCGGRWVSVLEGGYHLEALATGVENLLRIKLREINSSEG